MRTRILVIGVLFVVAGWARSAEAALCIYTDPVNPSSGKLMKWPSSAMPIPYLINATDVPAANKTAFIDAVKAAFAAYEAVTCSELKFKYAGESASVSSAGLKAILVVFRGAGGTGGCYWYVPESAPPNPEIIVDALIQMNLQDLNCKYAVGKVADAIDVQTAVTQMLPGALGFYVGGDPVTGNLAEIKFDYVNTTLSEDQKKGVQFYYFKADTGCVKPAQPATCPPRTSPTSDGGKPRERGTTPTGDGYKPTGDGYAPTGDGAVGGDLGGKKGDNGCCRVSHASDDSAGRGLLALAGLTLLLVLHRRRRSR